jgi:hypothetical protein
MDQALKDLSTLFDYQMDSVLQLSPEDVRKEIRRFIEDAASSPAERTRFYCLMAVSNSWFEPMEEAQAQLGSDHKDGFSEQGVING